MWTVRMLTAGVMTCGNRAAPQAIPGDGPAVSPGGSS